jgi:metal-sulfur cluster biosynthetic enzyme
MISTDTVTDALRTVYDPELGIDIVSLGLVYGVDVAGDTAIVTMTLTSPGCPLGGLLEAGVRTALAAVPGVGQVDVRIVWEPPWGPERIAPDVLARLRG